MTKNRIKRVISIVLMLAMLSTVVAVFSGCGLFTKKVVGTEAAKILLARERLNEELIGQKMNVFSASKAQPSTDSSSNSFWSKLLPWMNVNASVVGNRLPLAAAIAPGVTVGSDTVVWDTFKDASSMKVSFAQFIEPIDDATAEAAELIAMIKEDVGITDKWVDTLTAKYMLIVDEDSETIIEYYKPYDSISISTRYTTDDAKCVYEMYSFMSYDDGTTGDIREKCIPGEYYEYAYRNSDGYIDYFIADNSRGYWLMNRFDIREDTIFFDMSSVKGDIGYGIDVLSSFDENGMLVPTDVLSNVDIFSPNVDRDLLKIVKMGDRGYEISVYMTNVGDGIASLSAGPSAYHYEAQYGHVSGVYLSRNDYGSDGNVTINLENGGKIRVGDGNGSVTYIGSTVDYNLFFGEETYTGELTFNVNADNEAEAFKLLTSYLSSNGISLRSNSDEINEAYSHAELLYTNFDVMEWNGYRMNSRSNLLEAEGMLLSDFEKYKTLYEEVKDYETVSGSYDVKRSVTFGKMSVTSKGTATYDDGIIRIDGLTASTEANEIFESGVSYSLKVGLARLDENGEYSSANTVTLFSETGEGDAPIVYANDDMSYTLSGTFYVPEALSEGEYMVVVYFATEDGGIRVTEMAPIAFYSAEDDFLNSEFMKVSVKRVGENLLVKYEIRLTDTVVADYAKDSYTYDEIERILLRGVLAKGYPASGAVVQNDKGEALSKDGSHGAGTYRLKYLVNTSAGLVEAYMYTELENITLN